MDPSLTIHANILTLDERVDNLKYRLTVVNNSKNTFAESKIKGESPDPKPLIAELVYVIAGINYCVQENESLATDKANEATVRRQLLSAINTDVKNLKEQLLELINKSPVELKNQYRKEKTPERK
jgi:hypothetical protein